MHILLLSDSETSGGAAIAASRLATGLTEAGHRITRIVNYANGIRHSWDTEVLAARFSLAERAASRFLGNSFRKQRASRNVARAFTSHLKKLRPDVINIHNLHSADEWPMELVRISAGNAPVVWTLHDMWSFTGRCAYSYDCTAFRSGCDAACPTPHEYPALEPNRIAEAWETKREILKEHRQILAVCPSAWLAAEAQHGLWTGHRVEVIPYGVPLNIYEPIDRNVARSALGLPSKGPLVVTSADVLSDRRKGGAFLVAALQIMKTKPLTLLTMGRDPVYPDIPGIAYYHLGHVDHERTRALAYAAADVMAHPALADNLPNTILESIACATPVVAFQTCGIPELVRPGVTGWLASALTADAFAGTLDEAIMQVSAGSTFRESCRRVAEKEYSIPLQGFRYTTLFDTLR